MNLVERFFRDLTEDVVRQGSFTSVDELVQAMTEYLEEHNLRPKPYVWKKKGEEILANPTGSRCTRENQSETLTRLVLNARHHLPFSS